MDLTTRLAGVLACVEATHAALGATNEEVGRLCRQRNQLGDEMKVIAAAETGNTRELADRRAGLEQRVAERKTRLEHVRREEADLDARIAAAEREIAILERPDEPLPPPRKRKVKRKRVN